MKLRFKIQEYQTRAVKSVVDCFAGQPNVQGIRYRIDPGAGQGDGDYRQTSIEDTPGFKDDAVRINVEQIFRLLSSHTEVRTI